MGIEGACKNIKSGNMDRLSTPPGFASRTSFVLRKFHQDKASPRSGQEQATEFGTYNADILPDRPWIVHDHTTPISEPLKPTKSETKRRLKVSATKVFEDAPVFHPSEEGFSDTLSYIASLHNKAEPYGICCVVPPPSWKPPCLLKEKKIWEASTFFPQVQLIDGFRSENPKMKKEADADSGDSASDDVKFCIIQRGPEYTLKRFKDFADSYKKKYFSMVESVADNEKEYRELVESSPIELGVLYGNDVDTTTFGSGFPLSIPSESCKYRTSGWNLNNTAKLPGSLLSFEDCKSVCVPRLSVGMCFSSQFWKSEKERLYALCYLHTGAPRVWYSVAGCHRSKFTTTMKRLIPEMSGEQPKKSHDPVMIMSPYQLNMEGIPVTRCVQYPGQYVIIFPGSYYYAFDCGFNCLEKTNFAPMDWLPHGDVAVQLNQEKSKKSLIPYDKLLFSAAREAVKCFEEYIVLKKNKECYDRWNAFCGKDGILSSTVKSRVKREKHRHEFFSQSLQSQRMDKSYDAVSIRECCVCLGDLYLSAVKCSCSPDRYTCLSHMRKLCSCSCFEKSFLYRYDMDELNHLVEALEDIKVSAIFRWVRIDKMNCASAANRTSSQSEEDEGKKTEEGRTCNITRKDVGATEKTRMEERLRSMADILNVKEGKNDGKETLKSCSVKSKRPSSDVDKSKKQKHG